MLRNRFRGYECNGVTNSGVVSFLGDASPFVANNVFDEFPDEQIARNSFNGIFIYPRRTAPFGFNGGFYYSRDRFDDTVAPAHAGSDGCAVPRMNRSDCTLMRDVAGAPELY